MQHYEKKLTASDGIILYSQGWFPDEEPKAVVLLIHGLGEYSGRYEHVATHFARNQYAFTTFDLRGHGISTGKRGHSPSFKALMDDINLVLGDVEERFPGSQFYLYGHSLGALIALNFSLRRKNALSGLICTGPGLRSELLEQRLKVTLSKVVGLVFPGLSITTGLNPANLSRNSEVVENYIQDPLIHDRTTLGFAKDNIHSIDYVFDQADRLDKPLLLMHGTDDRICYPQGSIDLAELVPGECHLKLWDGLYHEIHNEPERDQILNYMLDWLSHQLASRQ